LSPIVIAILLASLETHIIYVLVGLFVCAIWLSFDLWPWCNWIGIRGANYRVANFMHHYGGYGKHEAEAKRNSLQVAFRSIAFAALSLLVLVFYSSVVLYISRTHIEDEQAEVFQHLNATLTLPSDRLLKNAKFTITNNSSLDVALQSMTCDVRVAVLQSGFSLGDVLVDVPMPRLNLHAGGDAESMNCPSDNGVLKLNFKDDGLACGDVVWAVNYVIADQTIVPKTKRYRYTLDRDEHEWTPTALEAPPTSCK
jgi:hypothetical protein